MISEPNIVEMLCWVLFYCEEKYDIFCRYSIYSRRTEGSPIFTFFGMIEATAGQNKYQSI